MATLYSKADKLNLESLTVQTYLLYSAQCGFHFDVWALARECTMLAMALNFMEE